MSTESSPISFFLLRGLGREVRHWGEFCNLLEKTRSHFKVVPLEIPGSGVLRGKLSPISTDGYVEELRTQYIRKIQPNHINIILGLSFGGMIAARWINDFPTDFHGAILINTSGRPSPYYKRLRVSAAITLLIAAFHRNGYHREKKITSLICNLVDTEDLARKWQIIAESAPVSSTNMLRQLYTAAKFSLPSQTTLPSLLLCSTKDRLVAADCSHSIAAAWNISLIPHPTAGHDLTTDDPDWCITQVLSWLPNVHSR